MPGDSSESGKRHCGAWYLLLLVPFIGVLFPGWYNSVAPTWGGMPYFYWYQLLWVVIASVLTGIVYLVMR